jgi:hypothetical protein
VNPRRRSGDLAEIIEADKQPIRGIVFSQAGPNLPKQCPSAGAGEIRIYLFFQAHVTNHRRDPFLGLSDATVATQ